MGELGTGASWRLQPASWEELLMFFLERRSKEHISPEYTVVSLVWIPPHLWWIADFAGKVMFILADRQFAGNSFEERLVALWLDLRQWYRATNSENQLGSITATMIRAFLTEGCSSGSCCAARPVLPTALA